MVYQNSWELLAIQLAGLAQLRAILWLLIWGDSVRLSDPAVGCRNGLFYFAAMGRRCSCVDLGRQSEIIVFRYNIADAIPGIYNTHLGLLP